MYKKKNLRGFKPRSDYLDVSASKGESSKMGEGRVNYTIDLRMMKDLPRSTYSIKAEPYQEANEVATAYHFLAPFNKQISARYGGDDNISSGNIVQYMNSNRSNFLSAIDAVAAHLKVNYRYIKPTLDSADDDVSDEIVDKMKASIAETLSLLGATTYTELAINDYWVATDLRMGTDYGVGKMGHATIKDEMKYYTHPVDVVYAMLMYYQVFLQSVVNCTSQFNKFRAHQGHMMMMCWDRETPRLNELFSLMNKKSLLSKLDSFGLTVEGEYFDSSWMLQANTAVNLTSRKSNSIQDPIKEVIATYSFPNYFRFGFVDENGEIPTSPVVEYDHSGMSYNSSKLGVIGIDRTFQLWAVKSSIIRTLEWARDTDSTLNQLGFYNEFVELSNAVTQFCDTFKSCMNDLRIAMDTLSRTGVITWVKGVRPRIQRETNLPVASNLIVDHIISNTIGGSSSLEYNGDSTMRWGSYSLWNMYSGIPEYDTKSGGAFMAFATKNLNISNYSEDWNAKRYVPVAFSVDTISTNDTPIRMLDRLGHIYDVDVRDVTMASNDELSRLVPLPSQSHLTIRVPHVVYTTAPELTNEKSFALVALVRIFGLGRYDENDEITVDPDLISVFEYQIEDISNTVIAYAKENGPFRGTNSAAVSSLGFLGFNS